MLALTLFGQECAHDPLLQQDHGVIVLIHPAQDQTNLEGSGSEVFIEVEITTLQSLL